MFWNLILKVFGGGLLDKLADIYKQKTNTDLDRYKTGVDADKHIIMKQIEADIEARKLASASRKADRGSLWTVWMVPAGFGISLLHYSAVILDSLPLFGHDVGSWAIPKLPPPYDSMQSAIILSAFGIVGATRLVGRIFAK